jgi:hypothetical protein
MSQANQYRWQSDGVLQQNATLVNNFIVLMLIFDLRIVSVMYRRVSAELVICL